ncbi:MAG: electron transfer flavoprotein subunit beta/FixA family protein [Pseudomonadota bacterium]|nr:electron transfer flavoprotein subunit beta/FixA family protein [Pseudomonadota bacterium]
MNVCSFFLDMNQAPGYDKEMKILVCIKQVGDDGEISRFDVHALEEALNIKDQSGAKISASVTVDVVTVGPLEAAKIIRRAFGLGADRGYHIVTEDPEYVSSFITATRLAVVAKKIPYDLILTGIMSEDMMAGQIGPMLAEIMGFPCATGVIKASLPSGNNEIEVERELENGFRDCLAIRFPAVLTIQAGINTPRYPRLSNMLAAGQKEITNLIEADFFPELIPTRDIYRGLESPKKTRSGRILEGSLSDKAEQLLAVLKEKDLI